MDRLTTVTALARTVVDVEIAKCHVRTPRIGEDGALFGLDGSVDEQCEGGRRHAGNHRQRTEPAVRARRSTAIATPVLPPPRPSRPGRWPPMEVSSASTAPFERSADWVASPGRSLGSSVQ